MFYELLGTGFSPSGYFPCMLTVYTSGHSDFSSARGTLQLLYVSALLAYYFGFFTDVLHRLVVGLFSIAGLGAVAFGPILGRVIDRLVPWYAALASTLLLIIFQAVQTGAGGINLGAVIVAILGLDIFRQTQQVSLMASVFRYVHTVRIPSVTSFH